MTVTNLRKVGSAEPVILQTLLRGLSVLDAVADSGGRATAKKIAHELDIRPATCYHLLRTLVSDGYLVRGPAGTYDIGPRGGQLGHHLERQFGPSSEHSALLMRLHIRTKETAYISGWNQGMIVIQQFIGGSGPVSVGNLDVGYGAHLHARASCLSVLAYLPLELVRTMLFGTEFEKLTPNTIGSYGELVKRLDQVRTLGYAVDREEFTEGVTCVSAPYFAAGDQPAGSFTVSVATSRYSSQSGALASAVLEAASLATKMCRTGDRAIPTAIGDGAFATATGTSSATRKAVKHAGR